MLRGHVRGTRKPQPFLSVAASSHGHRPPQAKRALIVRGGGGMQSVRQTQVLLNMGSGHHPWRQPSTEAVEHRLE